MSDDTEHTEPGGGRESRGSGATGVVAMLLPFATALAALALGAILGGVIGYIAKQGERVEVKVPRDLTAAELAEACAPELETKVGELETAQNKVAFLEKEVTDRETRVKELEAELARRPEEKKVATGGTGVSKELAQARKDLEEARAELVIARQEKEQLVVELTATKEQLAKTEQQLTEQVEKTETAKEDALVNKWYRFVSDSQLEVCEKGNRKKLGNCREALQSSLMNNTRRDRFAHCVRSGQAVPSVRELQKEETLPDFAEMIDEEQKQTKGWYVMFCDPTLPERNDGFLGEEHLPPTASAGAGQ
jgi:chromosome segregation ATPase